VGGPQSGVGPAVLWVHALGKYLDSAGRQGSVWPPGLGIWG